MMTRYDCGNDPNCSDPNCCSTKTPRNSGWKSLFFIVVILAAVAVASYSMLTRGIDSSCATPCANISSIEAWKAKLSGYDFAFVVMLSSNQSLPDELSKSVVSASMKIESKNLRTRTLILHAGNPGFEDAAGLLKIESFPAVVALGKSNSAMAPQGAWSEADLMRAYRQASAASCCPSPPPK